MEQVVKVITTDPDGTAKVMHIRESACSGDCHKCSGCGAAQQTMLFTAVNAIGAKNGELEVVETKSGPVLLAATVLYMMPLALFFVGFFVGAALWQKGALMGCVAFVLGICLAVVYDRKALSRQNTVYTITGYPAGAQRKGDNDLE